MGVKKIARPINNAKNLYIKWLNKNNATHIDVFEGTDKKIDDLWDYYRSVSAFIGDSLYSVYFHMWQGEATIKYSDSENSYEKMTIDEFLTLIN